MKLKPTTILIPTKTEDSHQLEKEPAVAKRSSDKSSSNSDQMVWSSSDDSEDRTEKTKKPKKPVEASDKSSPNNDQIGDPSSDLDKVN